MQLFLRWRNTTIKTLQNRVTVNNGGADESVNAVIVSIPVSGVIPVAEELGDFQEWLDFGNDKGEDKNDVKVVVVEEPIQVDNTDILLVEVVQEPISVVNGVQEPIPVDNIDIPVVEAVQEPIPVVKPISVQESIPVQEPVPMDNI